MPSLRFFPLWLRIECSNSDVIVVTKNVMHIMQQSLDSDMEKNGFIDDFTTVSTDKWIVEINFSILKDRTEKTFFELRFYSLSSDSILLIEYLGGNFLGLGKRPKTWWSIIGKFFLIYFSLESQMVGYGRNQCLITMKLSKAIDSLKGNKTTGLLLPFTTIDNLHS